VSAAGDVALHAARPPADRMATLGLWTAATLLVLFLHGAAAFIIHRLSPPQGSTEPASQAFLVELAPVAAAPEAVPDEVAEIVEPAARSDGAAVDEEVEPPGLAESPVLEEPTIVEEPPAEEAAAELVDEIAEAPEPVEEAASEPEPADEAAELPATMALLPTARPEPPEPAPRQARQQPRSQPAPAREPAAEASARQRPAASEAARPRATESGEARAPAPSEARGAEVSPSRWQSRLNAHLNRFKRFPRGARSGGTVSVRFTIDPSGQVLAASVASSSGDAALDQAAVDMVRRASPVPAPPPSIAQARMNLALPVRFDR
jgi:protein TonB